MKRGSIVLTKFPFTDLSSAKRRPGIVLSGKSGNKNDVIAFISSIIPSNPEETDYLITTQHKDFTSTGLKKESVIKLDKLATINLSIVSGEIGQISDENMIKIDRRLKLALGLK